MTNRYPPPPPDEPIIGGGYAPSTTDPAAGEPAIGAGPDPARPGEPLDAQDDWDDAAYDDEDYIYAEDEYYEGGPEPRSPLIYIGIAVGAVLVIAAVIAGFALFGGGDPNDPAAEFNVAIDAPRDGQRVETGKPLDVVAQASSNEAIVLFELLVDGRVVEDFDVADPQPAVVVPATLQHVFEDRGDHQLAVRVTSESGATMDSAEVRVVVIEPITDSPVEIEGEVVAAVNARTGPGSDFEVVGSLPAGEVVTITGKTRDASWLLVDSSAGSGVWVPANSIDALDSLALVQVREPTPTPAPTEEPTEEPTAEPTEDRSLPDLVPAGAVLVDGGASLRVTVLNNGGSNYTGSLVVSVSGVTGGTLTEAFSVSILAGGNTSVDLTAPEITEQKSARVTVDPDNAIDELAEDNNTVTFTVNPVEEEPAIVIGTLAVGNGALTVTILNQGGDMPSSAVVVRFSVTVDGQTTSAESSATIALAKNQEQSFTIANAPSGTGIAAVLIDGVQVASANASVP